MQQKNDQTSSQAQANSGQGLVNQGLLLLRLGTGAMFIIHGWPKLQGGPELWTKLGQAMELFGINFWPAFWGLLAAISEVVGGFLLMIGFLFRPACLFLLGTMSTAAAVHFSHGDPFSKASHAIEAGILFLSLLLIGPGKYALRLRKGSSTQA